MGRICKQLFSYVMSLAMCVSMLGGMGITGLAAKSASVSEDKALTYEVKANGYEILIKAKKGVFKEGTTVSVKAVNEKKEADIRQAVMVSGGRIQPLKDTASFDLVFRKDDKRVNPKEKISVSIKVKSGIVPEGGTVKAYKVDSDMAVKAVESSYKNGKISFYAEKSGIYTVAVEGTSSIGAWTYTGKADPVLKEQLIDQKEITINKDFVDKFNSITGDSTKGEFNALRWALSDESKSTLVKVDAASFPTIQDSQSRRIMIYSGKTLDLGGATLKRNSDENVIVTGNPDESHGGYYYKNITIKNGTIDGGSDAAGVCRFARVEGLTIDGINFVSFGQHAAEFAAVKNVSLTNCSFKSPNYNPSSIKSGYEALSFDMTSNDKDFTKYAPADYLTCENFVIDNCTFEGVYRAMGSHHFKDGKYYEGVKVTNCHFNNIADTAIESCGWKNGLISGNTFQGVGYGVDFQQPPELIKGGKYSTYTCNNVVDGNTFVMAKTGAKATHVAIRAGGFTMTKAKYGLKKGQYNVNGFTISNNHISGPNTDGISMEYTSNSNVIGNNIVGTEGNSIQFVMCDNCKATGKNITENSLENGVYVKASQNITVDGCVITKTNKQKNKNASSNGVHINNQSSNVTVKNCTISGGQWEYGVCVIGACKNVTIKSNTIENTKKNGIKVTDKKSSAKAIDKNKISGSKEHGIYLSNYATAKSVQNNTISKVKKGSYGIYISNHTKVNKLAGNKFSGMKKKAQTWISNDSSVKKK